MHDQSKMEQDLLKMYAQILENFVKAHELLEHDGEVCPVARAGIVAFLAHRVGADIHKVAEYLEEYDEEHNKAQREKGH